MTMIGEVTDDIRDLIAKGASEMEILKAARQNGMKTLSEAALQKVFEGVTTLDDAIEMGNIKKPYSSVSEEKKSNLNTVLVVDDDPNIRKMVKASLSKEPFRILEAENGQEGVEKAHQESPDLIIMDIMMPVLDGVAACRKLKSNLQTGHIPLMMFTAKDSDDSEIEGFEAGADDYITKPVSPRKLVTRVNKLLGKYSVTVPV